MRPFLGFAAAVLASGTLATTVVLQDNEIDYKILNATLTTPWTDDAGKNPWPEYPRPRLQRPRWKNLNGVWGYRNGNESDLNSPPFGQLLELPVLVPFCLESALSGMNTDHHRYGHCSSVQQE
jgi:hypothetical protein